MSKEVIQAILQLIQLIVQKKVNQGLTQGFVSVDNVSTHDTEQGLKEKLADAVGCDVSELFPEDEPGQPA